VKPTVLVVRPDSLGDVVLTGPAVRAVAAAARVAFLCSPTGRPAAERLPGVDAVLEHELPWIAARPRRVSAADVERVVHDVGALGPDLAIVLTSFHQDPLPTALLLRLAGVPRIAAMSENYPGSLLDVRLAPTGDVHEVERSLTLARALGFALPANDDGRLRLAAGKAPAGLLPSAFHPGNYVVVHAGASVPARAWSVERHERLVARLLERGERVALTGSGDERGLTARLARGGSFPRPDLVDLGGRTDLGALHAVMAGARAVVVGNSGPAHVAAAAGSPVVSLFAPTVPAARWRPWGVPHVLLGDQQIGCRECRARECPLDGHPCLASVTVADVLDAIDELTGDRLERAAPAHAPERRLAPAAPALETA
jgi:ADP-heptose:LPS heptosyltransferase